jgi:hypothetical protein
MLNFTINTLSILVFRKKPGVFGHLKQDNWIMITISVNHVNSLVSGKKKIETMISVRVQYKYLFFIRVIMGGCACNL